MANETDSETKGCTFEWKIENLSHCWWLRKGQGTESLAFIAVALQKTTWAVSLYPMGINDEKEVGIYLVRKKL